MPRRTDIRPDLTPHDAARSLGLATKEELFDALRKYRAAGVTTPSPDIITGRFDPVAWERFRRLRNPQFFPELTAAPTARDPHQVVAERRAEAWARSAR